jgi:hypothetical protein
VGHLGASAHARGKPGPRQPDGALALPLGERTHLALSRSTEIAACVVTTGERAVTCRNIACPGPAWGSRLAARADPVN